MKDSYTLESGSLLDSGSWLCSERLSNVFSAQFNTEGSLHLGENLLVGDSLPAFVLANHLRFLVDLRREVLLRPSLCGSCLLHHFSQRQCDFFVMKFLRFLIKSKGVFVGRVLTVASRHSLLLGRDFSSGTLSSIELGRRFQGLVDWTALCDYGDGVGVGIGSWAAVLGHVDWLEERESMKDLKLKDVNLEMDSGGAQRNIVKLTEALCKKQISAENIEKLRNRREKTSTEKCQENQAVSDKLKKQITELSHIRKTETVDQRIEKIDSAIDVLMEQTKPLRKALNPALYSTDKELLELVGLTARETLLEIGASAAIDPVDVGMKISDALKRINSAVEHYIPDKTEWCDEWLFDENMDEINELYDGIYSDSRLSENSRFASRLGVLHRCRREIHMFSMPVSTDQKEIGSKYISPVINPFNTDCDFILQLVDVERVEKQKKIREKTERSKKKVVGELVKVNDKASNVQSEEVSISNELKHVSKIFRKELKTRKDDKIPYYEFVINPRSFSRTVENMFYVSYLMRDRELFLVEENGMPYLKKPTFETEEKQKEAELLNSTHGVTSLSYEEWKFLCEGFKKSIIEPLDA